MMEGPYDRSGAMGTIPTASDWIPQFPGPRQQPASSGPNFFVASASLEEDRKLRILTTKYLWTQHWMLVAFLELSCGQKADPTYEIEVGITRQLRVELSSLLRAGSMGASLEAQLGTKFESTLVGSHTETHSILLKDLEAPKCDRLSVAVWQQVDDFTIEKHVQYKVPLLRGRRQVMSFPVRQNRRDVESQFWPDEDCCSERRENRKGKRRFAIVFPSGIQIVFGNLNAAGQISLEGIAGEYKIGEAVCLAAFHEERSLLAVRQDPKATFGILCREDDLISGLNTARTKATALTNEAARKAQAERDQLSEQLRTPADTEPTPIDVAVLEYIVESIQHSGRSPSIVQLSERFGLSRSAVRNKLRELQERGFIDRKPGSRSIRVNFENLPVGLGRVANRAQRLPVLGHVAAGSPIIAVREFDEFVSISEMVNRDDVFALKIRGDSMVEDAILDGDIVVVRREDYARDGDIVAVIVEGEDIEQEVTVKRFYRRGPWIRLMPANTAHMAMEFYQKDVRILGKVVGVIRTIYS